MDLSTHLRRTFLTGLFAAIPLVVTTIAVYYVDHYTQVVAPQVFGRKVPFLGLLIALAGVYGLGLLVSTAAVKWALSRADRLLERVPVVRLAYQAWKQVSLNQGPGGAGMWDKVALVSVGGNGAWELGFTSGVESPGRMTCAFVPGAPVPTAGRLYFLPSDRVRVLSVTPEEGLKFILSGGNYVPGEVTKLFGETVTTGDVE